MESGGGRADAEAEVSRKRGASAVGASTKTPVDATRSAIASSRLRASGGRRRTHRARQADARGEVGDGLHGLEVRGAHGDGAAAAPAAFERAPRRHARGHRGVQLTVAPGDRARRVGRRARVSGDSGRASRGAIRDGLHRVTSHRSVEGTRDFDRTKASDGGCALRPAATRIDESSSSKSRSFASDLAARAISKMGRNGKKVSYAQSPCGRSLEAPFATVSFRKRSSTRTVDEFKSATTGGGAVSLVFVVTCYSLCFSSRAHSSSSSSSSSSSAP